MRSREKKMRMKKITENKKKKRETVRINNTKHHKNKRNLSSKLQLINESGTQDSLIFCGGVDV